MNKKLLSLVMTGVLAVGVFSVVTPYEAQARRLNQKQAQILQLNVHLVNLLL